MKIKQTLEKIIAGVGIFSALTFGTLNCGSETDGSDASVSDSGSSNYDSGSNKDIGAGYDASVPEQDIGSSDNGEKNEAPVVIIETKDNKGNVKDSFQVREKIYINFSKSYDPDCNQKNNCGGSNGIESYEMTDNFGNKDLINCKGGCSNSYPIFYTDLARGKEVVFSIKCFDYEGASSTVEKIINITN